MYKLYRITNTINGKSYIGITKLSVGERWNIHISNSKDPKYPLHYAIAKYGPDAFTLSVIKEHADRVVISALEEPTIQLLETHITQHGYNVAKGGYGGDLGPEANLKRSTTIKNYSPERKAEVKENLRLRNLGRTKDTDLGRLAQSEKIKGNKFGQGIPHDQETKEKISNANRGKVRSPESIEKYKKAAKMRGAPWFKGKTISCLCCKRSWDIGNYSQHIRKKHELQ